MYHKGSGAKVSLPADPEGRRYELRFSSEGIGILMHKGFGNRLVADCFERQVGKTLREDSGAVEFFLSGGTKPPQWLSVLEHLYTTKCFK